MYSCPVMRTHHRSILKVGQSCQVADENACIVIPCELKDMHLFHIALLLLLTTFASSNMHGMKKREEQRAVLKFLTASGKWPTECFNELQAVYSADAMSKSQVGVWHRHFRGGDISLKDKPRPGRLVSVNTAANQQALCTALDADRRSSVRILSDDLGINRTTAHKIIKKTFGMSKVAPKFVPCVLTDEMKRSRLQMAQQNLDRFAQDPSLLSKVVTGDESYFSLFDLETKLESMQWKTKDEPRPKKALHNCSEKKTMLTCFFDESGVILAEF